MVRFLVPSLLIASAVSSAHAYGRPKTQVGKRVWLQAFATNLLGGSNRQKSKYRGRSYTGERIRRDDVPEVNIWTKTRSKFGKTTFTWRYLTWSDYQTQQFQDHTIERDNPLLAMREFSSFTYRPSGNYFDLRTAEFEKKLWHASDDLPASKSSDVQSRIVQFILQEKSRKVALPADLIAELNRLRPKQRRYVLRYAYRNVSRILDEPYRQHSYTGQGLLPATH